MPESARSAEGSQRFEITVDGEPVPCIEGQTLAAAMVAARVLAWRRTRKTDEERGLFCGIGVCFDCLVTVNGTPSVRACVSAARPGDALTTQARSRVAGP